MSRDPTERYSTVADFRQAIVDYLQHRISIALGDAASERVHALSSLFEAAGTDPPEDLRQAYQLVAEARYGFTQALDEWKENGAARKGLESCVLLAVELELRQEHLESAEALLSELGKAPKDLRERVRELRHQKARARAEDKRLRGLAHDLDTSVSSKERGRVMAAVGGAMLAVAIYAVSQPNPNRLRPVSLLAFSVMLFLVLSMAVFTGRKYLFKNAFNRRLVGLMLLTGLTLIGSRTIGWRVGLPVPQVFVQDLVGMTGIAASATILMSRHLWPIPLVTAGGAIGCVLEPSWCVTFFSLSALTSLPLVAFGLWRHRQEQERRVAEEVPESIRLEE